MTSSGKNVEPTIPGMITMELPHIWRIAEVIYQLIFINDPQDRSLEPPLPHRHVFVMPRFL